MTWGAALWGRGSGTFALYEAEAGDHAFFIQLRLRLGPSSQCLFTPQDLFSLPIPAQDTLPSSQAGSAWEIVSSITLWRIWCSRCSHVIGGQPSTASDILSSIWADIIFSLRCQWDRCIGSSRAARERYADFMRIWDCSLFFCITPHGIRWFYKPPPWLFSDIVEARDRVLTLPPPV